MRTTIRKRMVTKIRQLKPELRKRMLDPVAQTGLWLKSVVQGHFNYYAVPGNTASLSLVPAPGARALVPHHTPPEPKAPDWLDTYAGTGSTVASQTKGAPSLPGGTLRRHTSEIRTGCANQRPSGSVRGVPGDWYPYRARQLHGERAETYSEVMPIVRNHLSAN